MALKSTWRKVDELEANKQDELVSGVNIKTINSTSLLGSGNITISGGGISDGDKGDITVSGSGSVWTIDNNAVTNAKINDVSATKVTEDSTHRFVTDAEKTSYSLKQDALVSGSNLKTINSTSLLGSGDVAVQPTLVSGTNIKTINSTSLLGSGNIAITTSLAIGSTPITGGTIGRVLFENGGNVLGQDSALFWDNTNKRLGVGATPSTSVRLDVRLQGALSTDVGFRLRNSADSVNIMEFRGDGSFFLKNNTGNAYMYYDGSSTYEWATPSQLFLQTNTSTAAMNVMHNGNSAGTYLALRTQNTSLFIYRSGNFHFGASPQAGTGTNALMLETGTAPSTNVTDKCYIYSADVVAGNAAPHVRTENGNVIKLYQETTAVTAATVAGSGGTTITQNITFDGYTVRQVVRALRNLGILA